MALTTAEGAALLALAHAAIEDKLAANGVLPETRSRIAITDALAVARGCFVTLKTPGPDGSFELRGCIGSIEPRLPLHEAVVESAILAAFQDPRFTPLTAVEFAAVNVSVSALTPLEPIRSTEAIVVGRHGVVLEGLGGRAVFLPEVASDHGWSTSELLEQLSRKAGLPRSAWRDGRLWVFSSERFGEEAPAPVRIRRS